MAKIEIDLDAITAELDALYDAFSSEYPELFEKYKIEKVSEKFDFKINK